MAAHDDDDDDDRPRRRGKGGSGVACPKCGSRDIETGPWPWYLGTLGLMFCKPKICRECDHEFDARKPQADLGKRKMFLAIMINGVGLIGIIMVLGCLGAVIVSSGR